MQKILVLLLSLSVIFLALGLTGCASRNDTGMAVGGALGGLVGSVLTRGSVIGTVAGAVGGVFAAREILKREHHL